MSKTAEEGGPGHANPGGSVDESDSRTGITLTDDGQISLSSASIEAERPVTETWSRLASDESFQDVIVDAALDVVQGRRYAEADDRLEAAGIGNDDPALRSLILRAARGDQRAAWDLLREARQLGRGRSSIDDVLALAGLLEAALENCPDRDVPTIVVRLPQAFRDLRLEQRRDVCQLIATLANGADVRLVATGLVQRWLVDEHREDLPVSQEDITPGDGPPAVEGAVEAARDALDPDGLAVDVLRTVIDTNTETATYSHLNSAYPGYSESRIRQVAGELEELSLVARFDAASGRALEVRPAGRSLIAALDAEIGRQQGLEEAVSSTPNLSDNAVSRPEQGRGTPSAGGWVGVEYLSRSHHSAASGAATSGDLTLVDHPIQGLDDARAPGWSYSDRDDRLVVTAEYQNPLQYWVCIARSLTNWKTFEQVLDEDRLDEDIFEEYPIDVLRGARQLGYLPDGDDDGESYRSNLEDARDDLLDMTTRLHKEDYNNENQFRSNITQEAQGLAGAMVHLLDAAGVDVVREVRLPEYSRNYDDGRVEDLVRSLSKAAAIQSTYAEFAANSQLFESREEKRKWNMEPNVDAADPVGELCGSIVIVGPGIQSLEGELVRAIRSPDELHDDAPDFSISVDVATPGRSAFATTARELLDSKNIDVTREAVSVLQAFTKSPYDAAEALAALGTEKWCRDAHIDEIRYALSTLPADRILPDAMPTVSNVLHALLGTERPVSKSELADLADVSMQSLRDHLDRLLALDIVRDVDGGLRLTLTTSDERWNDVLPWYATPNRERDDYRDATEKGVLATLYAVADLEGTSTVIDALGSFTTTRIPPDVRREIVEVWPWIDPLLEVVRPLAADEPPQPEVSRSVTFGSRPDQLPVTQHAWPG